MLVLPQYFIHKISLFKELIFIYCGLFVLILVVFFFFVLFLLSLRFDQISPLAFFRWFFSKWFQLKTILIQVFQTRHAVDWGHYTKLFTHNWECRLEGFMPWSRVLGVKWNTAWSRIWTLLIDFISYDTKYYAIHTSTLLYKHWYLMMVTIEYSRYELGLIRKQLELGKWKMMLVNYL